MPSPYIIRNKWCALIPLLHQILAGTRRPDDFPDPQRASHLHDACAVWEALHYTFTSLLGWQQTANGLGWWYQAGQPTTDSELLQLISRLWGRDHSLDYYPAWTWQSASSEGSRFATASGFPDDAWWTAFRQHPETRWHDPYHGGHNPLHLGHSEEDPFGDVEGTPEGSQTWELFHDAATRRAVLIVDHIGLWRHALHQADGRLPQLGARSWYVQIFDRQYGNLGTFRKSRVTGRWFQGKHSIHMRGNCIPSACA